MNLADSRLCIATHGENLDWLARVRQPAKIYNATAHPRPGMLQVPNAAKDTGMYLRHIIAEYGNFAPYEIFLQGDPFDHCPALFRLLKEQPWSDKEIYPLGSTLAFYPHHTHYAVTGALALLQDLGKTLPPSPRWVRGTQFVVSRRRLMHYPLEFWQDLLRRAVQNPNAPDIFERAWLLILHPSPL